MVQHQGNARIIRSERLSGENFRLTLEAPLVAEAAHPGQFVMIKVSSGKDPLLRRPFSIHQASSNGHLQIYFRVVGHGTEMLTQKRAGEYIDIFGPLGRGYRIDRNRPACLVGGGLGIAPLLFLAKRVCRMGREHADDLIILGGRTSGDVEPLVDDFRQFGLSLHCATDDGSFGRRGFVTDILRNEDLAPHTVVYACGPEGMLAQVNRICADRGLDCQVSVESVMACGMGACLGCNIDARGGGYVHVCIDGPVFPAEELLWSS